MLGKPFLTKIIAKISLLAYPKNPQISRIRNLLKTKGLPFAQKLKKVV